MALNFPDTPTPGQTYVSGSSTWVWSGVSWDASTLGSQGTQGLAGSSQGTQGTIGAGTQGTIGAQGLAGSSQGTQGTIGAGTQGTIGVQGTTGSGGGGGVVSGVVAYAAAINALVGSNNRLNLTLGGNPTVDLQTTGMTDGQLLIFVARQSANGGNNITWGTNVGYGGDIASAPAMNTAVNVFDHFGFIYNSTRSKWLMISYARGY